MKLNWNSKLSASISAHIDALLSSERAVSNEEGIIARKTNALPVYSDMSGSLCVTPDGMILFYDSESGQVTPMTDERWCIIAAVSASEHYPDLRELLPARPSTAKSCSFCSGTG